MIILKKLVKLIFSEFLIGRATSIFYGWRGNYKSWEIASTKCKGYDHYIILDRVFATSLRVKNNEIKGERDSVPFETKIYSFPVLSAFLWIAVQKNSNLNILDFGGSLGSSYYQNSIFLNTLESYNYCIVEQPHFVNLGKNHFENDRLHFFYDMDECLQKFNIDAILLSAVIQYMEKPYELVQEIISKNFEYIIIDRTLLYPDKERLTIQKVPKKVYSASYCCWILDESKLLSMLSKKYEMIYDFDINETINIRAIYKGYLFRIRNLSHPTG